MLVDHFRKDSWSLLPLLSGPDTPLFLLSACLLHVGPQGGFFLTMSQGLHVNPLLSSTLPQSRLLRSDSGLTAFCADIAHIRHFTCPKLSLLLAHLVQACCSFCISLNNVFLHFNFLFSIRSSQGSSDDSFGFLFQFLFLQVTSKCLVRRTPSQTRHSLCPYTTISIFLCFQYLELWYVLI